MRTRPGSGCSAGRSASTVATTESASPGAYGHVHTLCCVLFVPPSHPGGSRLSESDAVLSGVSSRPACVDVRWTSRPRCD